MWAPYWAQKHSLWKDAQHSPLLNGVDALIDYTQSHPKPIIYSVALYLPLRDLHSAFSHLA